MKVKIPIYVTFDTNTYSRIARPQLLRIFKIGKATWQDRWDRIALWYLSRCIKTGRIVAAIPEAALKAEALRNTDRVAHLLAAGTKKAATPPEIPQTRQIILDAAFKLGFRVLRCPRIAYGAAVPVPAENWALDEFHDQATRQDRGSAFVRHFNNYPLEAMKDFGENLSTAHGLSSDPQYTHLHAATSLLGITLDRYLWTEGLAAEETAPTNHASLKVFHKSLRDLLSDWADFDIVADHYAYGYQLLCTEDKGLSTPNPIFGPTHVNAVTSTFGVVRIDMRALAKSCWTDYGFLFLAWK
jgi:hypothetical protein